MCILIFLQIPSEIFLPLIRIQRNITINVYCSSCDARYSGQIVIKFESSEQIFEKCSNIKFHEIPSSGRRFFRADRRMDRHDEDNLQFNKCTSSNNRILDNVAGCQYIYLCSFLVYLP